MRYLILLFASFLIFSACKKEEVINNNDPYFKCKIAGDDFEDVSPIAQINSSGTLIIDASKDLTDLRITIPFFSQISQGSTISLSSPVNVATVYYEGVSYWNTQSGNLIFTKIGDGVLSGTFDFISNELDNFQTILVTQGDFKNIEYLVK